MGTKLTLKQLASQLEHWYQRYTESPYFQQYRSLEIGLSHKASDIGYLEKGDLFWIAVWGGDEERHQLGTLIDINNTSDDVIANTRDAIQQLDNPANALRSLLRINYCGVSYGSKTLRCIRPQEYAAFDYHVRRGCENFLPHMEDKEAEIAGYVGFLELCGQVRKSVAVPGPRPEGLWYVADIEMGLFQFAFEGGTIIV